MAGSPGTKQSMGVTGVALLMALVACAPRFDIAQVQPEGGLVGQSQPRTDTVPSGAPTAVLPTNPGGTGGPASTGVAVPPVSTGKGARVTGGVIKVGGLFPLSGGLSSLGKPAYEGAQAYFNWINDHGGVRGKKIQFITCDDQADDTRSTTCAKRLVEQDGVFVMGPSFTPFSLTVIGQLEKAGVPWVGFDGINVEGFDASNVVTVGAPIETMAHALLPYWHDKIERKTGKAPSKIGAVVLDSAPAKTYVNEANAVICPKLGCEIVPRSGDRVGEEVTYTTLDYGSICRNMQNRRVDAVWIVTDPASAIKLLVACQGIGYKPPAGFLGQHGIYMDITLEQSGPFADGIYANGAVLPEDVEGAATREMKKVITTYYPEASFGYFTQLSYASAQMTVDLIDDILAAGADLTRTAIIAAARARGSYSCNGLCKSVSLAPPASRSGGNHNIWIVRSDYSSGKGRWVYEAGPIDAFRVRTWPCPGKPRPC